LIGKKNLKKIGSLIDINDDKNDSIYKHIIQSKIKEITDHLYAYNKTTESANSKKFKVYFKCTLNTKCKSKSIAIMDLEKNRADLYVYGPEHDHDADQIDENEKKSKIIRKRLRTR
jgi:hypothetical protein